MRKLFLALTAFLAVILATGVSALANTTGSEQVPSSVAVHTVNIKRSLSGVTTTTVDGKVTKVVPASVLIDDPYNDYVFAKINICNDNNIGTTWPIQTAQGYFESGNSTVLFSYAPPGSGTCGFPDSQTVHYSVYNQVDNSCFQLTGGFYTRASDGLRVWTGNIQAQMNNYYFACKDTAQIRANTISRLIGNSVGLASYNDPDEGCVMNRTFSRTYWYAGTCERNRLYYLVLYNYHA